MSGPLIWWTSEADCHAMPAKQEGALGVSGAPTYLRQQYRSRYGRNGRGRLWVDARFGGVVVDPWPNTPLAKRLGDDYAGIVIEPADLYLMQALPGVVTDFRLRRVT